MHKKKTTYPNCPHQAVESHREPPLERRGPAARHARISRPAGVVQSRAHDASVLEPALEEPELTNWRLSLAEEHPWKPLPVELVGPVGKDQQRETRGPKADYGAMQSRATLRADAPAPGLRTLRPSRSCALGDSGRLSVSICLQRLLCRRRGHRRSHSVCETCCRTRFPRRPHPFLAGPFALARRILAWACCLLVGVWK